MKILFTTYQGGIAGSTYSIFDLARGLKERGHIIHFAGRPEMAIYELMQSEGIQCHSVSFSSYFDLSSARKISLIIQSQQIDLVNSQSGIDRTVMIYCRLFFNSKFKLVFTRRQLPIDEPWIKRKLHLSFSDSIVTTSQATREALVSKGYPEEKMNVIPNGISQNHSDSSFAKTFKDQYEIRGPIIGCISRRKRQDILIQALPFLAKSCNVLFVGITKKDLVVPEEFCDRVIFIERIPREEAHKYFQLLDVHVLLSDAEGFGMALLEAMRAGVPSIASNVGGVTDIVNHLENGVLIENKVEELVKALNLVLEDEVFRNQLRLNGRKTVEDFTISKTVESFEQHFQKLISAQ